MFSLNELWDKLAKVFSSLKFQDDHYECVLRNNDTLWRIANEFTGDGDAHLQELVDANPQVTDPDSVQAGQTIHLPRAWFPDTSC